MSIYKRLARTLTIRNIGEAIWSLLGALIILAYFSVPLYYAGIYVIIAMSNIEGGMIYRIINYLIPDDLIIWRTRFNLAHYVYVYIVGALATSWVIISYYLIKQWRDERKFIRQIIEYHNLVGGAGSYCGPTEYSVDKSILEYFGSDGKTVYKRDEYYIVLRSRIGPYIKKDI